jgi:hypothetical protein
LPPSGHTVVSQVSSHLRVISLSSILLRRRSEVLALRGSGIEGKDVLIAQSLTQTRQGLEQ